MEKVMELVRVVRGATFTTGQIYIAGAFICETLEDKCRDLHVSPKVMHQTAIPEGRYDLIMSHSPRFNRILPEILCVPFFSSIRIHSGNSTFDTSGCILVGKVVNNCFLEQSKVNLERLLDNIKHYEINTIIIR